MEWLTVAVVIVLLIVVVLRLTPRRGVVLPGEEPEHGRKRDEQAPKDAGALSLPARAYTARETSLVHPEEVPLDAEYRAIVQRFAAADEGARRRVREAISADGYYQLIVFANREAVFAMRDGKRECIVSGLAATAMIDLKRIDHRDAEMTLAPLHYAARRCGIDPAPLLENAAAISTAEMRQTIGTFAARPEANKTLAKSLLHDVGTGFVRRMSARYQPTRDFTSAAVRVHHLLNADRYPGSDVLIAESLSEYWFPGVEAARRRIRAGAVLHARDEGEGDKVQSLMVFLAEAADSADAEALRRALRTGEGVASFAIARGNLVAAMVGHALFTKQPTIESDESLARFSAPLAKILADTLSRPAPRV